MIALSQDLNVPESERRAGIGWIGVVLVFVLSAIGFGVGAKVYFAGQYEEWFRDVILGVFTLVNSLRILAYVPQMLSAARDANGASGISYATWSLFLVSHLTTITYAIVYLGDAVMALIFLGNALACLAVIAITFVKRRRYAALLMQRI